MALHHQRNHAKPTSKVCVTICLGTLAVLGCGTIEFPETSNVGIQNDGGVRNNVGSEGPDAGVVTPDSGTLECTPVDVLDFPAAWPYGFDSQAYESHFLDILVGANTPRATCSGGTCHANNTNSPYIPTRAELSDPALLSKAIDELWEATSTPGIKSATLLRSAHLSGGEAEGKARKYSVQEDMRLFDFEKKTRECRWVNVYKERPDGGGGCPDASTGASGDSDGGTGSSKLCECPLEVRDLSHCEGF